jgi:hypothetical protein
LSTTISPINVNWDHAGAIHHEGVVESFPEWNINLGPKGPVLAGLPSPLASVSEAPLSIFNFVDALELLWLGTEVIVMIGEIGGTAQGAAADMSAAKFEIGCWIHCWPDGPPEGEWDT